MSREALLRTATLILKGLKMPSKGKNTGMEVENAILMRGGMMADGIW